MADTSGNIMVQPLSDHVQPLDFCSRCACEYSSQLTYDCRCRPPNADIGIRDFDLDDTQD